MGTTFAPTYATICMGYRENIWINTYSKPSDSKRCASHLQTIKNPAKKTPFHVAKRVSVVVNDKKIKTDFEKQNIHKRLLKSDLKKFSQLPRTTQKWKIENQRQYYTICINLRHKQSKSNQTYENLQNSNILGKKFRKHRLIDYIK